MASPSKIFIDRHFDNHTTSQWRFTDKHKLLVMASSTLCVVIDVKFGEHKLLLLLLAAAVASDDDSGRSIPHSLRLYIWRVKAHPSLTGRRCSAPWHCHDTLLWSGVTMSRNSGRCHASHSYCIYHLPLPRLRDSLFRRNYQITTYWQLALLYPQTFYDEQWSTQDPPM